MQKSLDLSIFYFLFLFLFLFLFFYIKENFFENWTILKCPFSGSDNLYIKSGEISHFFTFLTHKQHLWFRMIVLSIKKVVTIEIF